MNIGAKISHRGAAACDQGLGIGTAQALKQSGRGADASVGNGMGTLGDVNGLKLSCSAHKDSPFWFAVVYARMHRSVIG